MISDSDRRVKALGQGKTSKVLLGLTLPSVVTAISTVIYSLVDAAFIGRLGTSAIGAISVSFPIFSLIGGLGLVFGIGAGSIISRLLGAGQKDQAERAASTALVSVLATGALAGTVLFFLLEPILLLLGATTTILPYAMDYARILVFGSFITIVNMTLSSFVRSEGNAFFSMFCMLSGTGLNILLDPLLIFVLKMGIGGAAVATVIAQGLTLFLLLIYYMRGRGFVRIGLAYSKGFLFETLIIGLPPLVSNLLIGLVVTLMNNAARNYGDDAVAAVGITLRIVSFGMFLVFGYAQGFRPLAGYNFGAKRYDRVWEALKRSSAAVGLFCALFAVSILFFAEPVLSLFSSDPAVIRIGSGILRSAYALFPFFGFQVLLIILYQAKGAVREAAILTFSRQGAFLALFAFLLPRFFGLRGIILTPLLADAFVLVLSVFYLFPMLGILKESRAKKGMG